MYLQMIDSVLQVIRSMLIDEKHFWVGLLTLSIVVNGLLGTLGIVLVILSWTGEHLADLRCNLVYRLKHWRSARQGDNEKSFDPQDILREAQEIVERDKANS